MVRSEGDMSLKIPVTPPGIDPGTVRLLTQRLNHYATPGPQYTLIYKFNLCSILVFRVRRVKLAVYTDSFSTYMLVLCSVTPSALKELMFVQSQNFARLLSLLLQQNLPTTDPG